MNFYLLAGVALLEASGVSVVRAQPRSEQLLANSYYEGRELAVTRTRVAGQLQQVVAQYQAAWSQKGPVQRSRMGEWELLSRPHARGIELVQFREQRGMVEQVSSVLPLSRGALNKTATEQSQFLRALQLPSQVPVLAHIQDGQLALNGASQLSMAPEAAFQHVRARALQQDWRIEFERFDASKGGVLLLKGPQGERVNATLHAHQAGTALVVQESRPAAAQRLQ